MPLDSIVFTANFVMSIAVVVMATQSFGVCSLCKYTTRVSYRGGGNQGVEPGIPSPPPKKFEIDKVNNLYKYDANALDIQTYRQRGPVVQLRR